MWKQLISNRHSSSIIAILTIEPVLDFRADGETLSFEYAVRDPSCPDNYLKRSHYFGIFEKAAPSKTIQSSSARFGCGGCRSRISSGSSFHCSEPSSNYYVDIRTGLVSIFTLAVISLERMYAVC